MALTFQKLASNVSIPRQSMNRVYLSCDNWDDFGHKTIFHITIFDEQGTELSLGSTKIGYLGQNEGWTQERIPQQFESLPQEFFSLGQDADYYRTIIKNLTPEMAANILAALGDVANDANKLEAVEDEGVFNSSLLRNVNRTTIDHQFRRILRGEAPLSKYDFFYEKAANERYSGVKVEFTVKPGIKPSSNIHILIGRNGVGKTTLLNNMVDALLPNRGEVEDTGYFANDCQFGGSQALEDDYFAGVVSVSFSAFDPFTPPENQTDANAGMRYHYVGLKKFQVRSTQTVWGLKDKNDLCRDFTNSLKICFALLAKRERWVKGVQKLESDVNFAEMKLCQLTDVYNNDASENKRQFSEVANSLFDRMSSGHAIVLLSITKLVETVEEKTLVLLDEPESHLHPPLLSAFTRALSDLLVNRNGVAIIATHSPVILQEIPKTCVSILQRTRLVGRVDRPESETFGENVGVLTREVFGLEVEKSGFHDLLAQSVNAGHSYEEILSEYRDQLGFEGKAVLRALIANTNTGEGV